MSPSTAITAADRLRSRSRLRSSDGAFANTLNAALRGRFEFGHLLMTKIVLVAACALVDVDGRILLAQRPEGKSMAGLWEFPGGKVEAGERPEETLIRELHEELGIEVNEACLAPLTFASHSYEDFHLLMPLFICRRWGGIPHGRENQALKWVRAARLRDYPMPAADEPLIPHLQEAV
jgi:8-oxo-dGTP diphosphatase